MNTSKQSCASLTVTDYLPLTNYSLLFPFLYLIPDRFSLAYITYLWNILMFSRDFHKVL